MELGSLRRDMAAIDGGRWVAKDEVPNLQDIRIKAKGLGGSESREALAKLQRDGVSDADAIQQVVNTVCFVEIEGLTSGGKPVAAADIRDQLADPAMEPLALLILQAVQRVDATRETKAEALSKN
jgi:hypothetical protein